MNGKKSIKGILVILLVSVVISAITVAVYRFILKDGYSFENYWLDLAVFAVVLFISMWIGLSLNSRKK